MATGLSAQGMAGAPNNDVRDTLEVEKSGKIAGAVNVSRGLLEFRGDPDSPSHDKSFAKETIRVLPWQRLERKRNAPASQWGRSNVGARDARRSPAAWNASAWRGRLAR